MDLAETYHTKISDFEELVSKEIDPSDLWEDQLEITSNFSTVNLPS